MAVPPQRGRSPIEGYHDSDTDLPVFTFDPPLTAPQQALFDRLLALTRSAIRTTPDEWQTLEPVIDSLRTHRTRSDAAWSGMSAANRDAALIDWNRSITDLLRVLLRD